MKNKNNFNIKDLNKTKTSKKPDYLKRYDKAIQDGFLREHLDSIQKTDDGLLIYLEDVSILSNNDILRIHYRKSYKYRELWKNRLIKLIQRNKIKKINNPVLIEVLFIKKENKILDYDASISCLKYILDGIVKSEIITDDTIKEIPLITTRTIVDKKSPYNKLIVHIKELKEEQEIEQFYSQEFNSEFNKIKKSVK